MNSTEEWINNCFNDEHSLNANSSINVTDEGYSISNIDLLLEIADCPIVCNFDWSKKFTFFLMMNISQKLLCKIYCNWRSYIYFC